MQAFHLQNCKDSTKISQQSHLVAQDELEQQDHLFVMQPFDFQNSNDSTKITQKSHLVAQGELKQEDNIWREHDFPTETLRD